ncbi:MAG: DUF2147 domain-containing protein, partial [Treponema sp.]|nr:DUF2147 domain-containing protein [Treponema sp.]
MNRYCFIMVLFFMGIIWTNAQELEGLWLTTNGESIVQIYKVNNVLYQGRLIWTADQSDEAKNYHGSMVLIDFEQIDTTVFKGQVNDPEKQRTYSCTITMKNENALDLRGYIGIPLFGRTEY